MKGESLLLFLDSNLEEEKRIAFLSEANRFSKILEINLYGISFNDPGISKGTLEEYGMSKLFVLRGEGFEQYDQIIYGKALIQTLESIPFRFFFFPHSEIGADLAPFVASRLNEGVIMDVIEIRVRDNRVFYVKEVFDGQFEEELSFFQTNREILTLNLDSLDIRKSHFSSSLQIEERIFPKQEERKIRTIELIPPDFRTVDLSQADLVIGIGAGCLGNETFDLIKELSELIGASLGATRPVVDEGFMPKERMIGQTGKSISPKLYLTLGISGSPHHVAGIKGAQKIVSLNRDRVAPIFQFSDLGFVCDVKEVLPLLLERIRKER